MTMQDLAARPAAAGRMPWWRAPFSPDIWRHSLYALLALPVGIACLPLALLGGSAAAARLQRGLAGGLLTLPAAAPPRRMARARVIAHALGSLPLNLVSFALTGYLWLLIVTNLAYPARSWVGMGDGSYQDAWGGPSLAGAWAVHAVAGLAFLLAAPWIIGAVTGLQGRLLRRLLGAGRYPHRS